MTLRQERAAAVRDPVARVLAAAGIVGAALAVLLIGALHAITPEVDPVRRTISEYALGEHKPVFDAGVLSLAGGSFAILLAALRVGLVAPRSVAALGLLLWPVALCVVVAFEKVNWSIGPTPSGYVHRYASVVAFLALPFAAIALGRRLWRGPTGRRFAAWTAGFGVLALLWFSPIVVGLLTRPLTGVPWYRLVPLGFVERGLALAEVAVVIVLGCWTLARSGRSAEPA